MKEFLITKTLTAQLVVQCDDADQARSWVGKIVATLEDENGRSIKLAPGMDFEASSSPAECRVEWVG